MVAAWTWAKRPSMMHPRNKLTGVASRLARAGGGSARCHSAGRWVPARTAPPSSPPRAGAVAPSIPIANRTRPHPASRRGIPVVRARRPSAYITRDTPEPVIAASPTRASVDTPRWSATRPPSCQAGPEGPQGGAPRPRGGFQRQGPLQPGQGAPQPPQPIGGRVAAPADRADGGARGDPLVAHLVLQQIEQLVARVGEATDPERHGASGEALGGPHPQRVPLVGAQRAEAAARGGAQARLLGRDQGRRPGEAHPQKPAPAPPP